MLTFTTLFCSLLCAAEAVIPQLGHRSFRQREAAHRFLTGLGDAARPALERAGKHPDPEVRRRAGQLRAPWAEKVADDKSRRMKPRDYPHLPWIDDGVVGIDVYDRYMDEARKSGFRDDYKKQTWPAHREATRLWVKSQIYQKRPRREILDVLDRLVAAERMWIETSGQHYTPPIPFPARE